jgi:hypothetical protein
VVAPRWWKNHVLKFADRKTIDNRDKEIMRDSAALDKTLARLIFFMPSALPVRAVTPTAHPPKMAYSTMTTGMVSDTAASGTVPSHDMNKVSTM